MPKDQLERPEDLISAEEAGKMAGKKKDTVRGWVRNGKLTGYRLDPSKKNSTLMVSKYELQVYLGTEAQVTHPNNTGRPPISSVSLVEKEKEIENLKKELEEQKSKCGVLQREIVEFKTFTDRLQMQLESRGKEVLSLSETLKSVMELQTGLRDDNRQLQADNRQLTAYISLPWWKKMTSILLLEDNNKIVLGSVVIWFEG